MKNPLAIRRSDFLSPAVAVAIGLTGLSHGASIILVTQDEVRDADLVNHLTSLGHSVSTGSYATLDTNAGDVAALNAADLVMVSRNTNSGDYASNADEVAAWDALATTVLLGNSYISRSNRWNWIGTEAIQTDYGLDISAPPGTTEVHPFFDGLTPGTIGDPAISGMDKYNFSTSSDLPDGGSVLGDGLTIGVRNNASFQNVVVASWAAGEVTGSGNPLGNDRYFYATPEDFSNYTANGVLLLNNIVATAIPEPSSAVLALPAVLGLLVRRRRH